MPTVCPCPPIPKVKTPFQLSVKAGVGIGPTALQSTYTNIVLKDALDINVIYVNNTPETAAALQFTFNAVVGKLTRYQSDGVTPNPWQTGDVLIINYAKMI